MTSDLRLAAVLADLLAACVWGRLAWLWRDRQDGVGEAALAMAAVYVLLACVEGARFLYRR